jgi:hypothetical protein
MTEILEYCPGVKVGLTYLFVFSPAHLRSRLLLSVSSVVSHRGSETPVDPHYQRSNAIFEMTAL